MYSVVDQDLRPSLFNFQAQVFLLYHVLWDVGTFFFFFFTSVIKWGAGKWGLALVMILWAYNEWSLVSFSPGMTGSRMSFSLPPKLTALHIRTAPPTPGPGTLGRRWWAASCFFPLALAIIWLRNTPGMWLWFRNAPCPVCVWFE